MAYKKKYQKYLGSTQHKIDKILFFVVLAVVTIYYLSILASYSITLFFITVFGGAIVLGLGAFLLKLIKDRKYRKIKNIEDMQHMGRRDFEHFTEYVFRKNGYKAKVRSGNQDGGVDVDATKGKEKIVVQCKKWSWEKVGVEKLREFYGVINMAGATKGIFVTTSELTDAALGEYEKMKDKLEVWDKNNLEAYVEEFRQKK